MRILIIADIHGNLPALKAVLSEAKTLDKVICLGDLAGYFPYINEVIETIASLDNLICIKGNHDHVLVNENLSTGSFSADQALSLQRNIISEVNKKYLTNLPETLEIVIDGRRFFLYHGSPKDPLDGRDIFWENSSLEQGVYLFGHTHKPFFQENSDRGWMVINPGSCGLPRDGDYRASYAIFETENGKTVFHRTAYLINIIIEKCSDVGLPKKFWKSLEAGEWISDIKNKEGNNS